MYGAGPSRTQAQPVDPRSAAVPGRLVARSRHADRVPGGRLGRRRVHRERPGDRARARYARWKRDLASRHAAREDGRVARGLARPGDRPRHGRPRLGAPPLRRQAALALHDRLADRVLAGRDRRRRRLRRMERHDHGARPAHASGALAQGRRLQGHVVGCRCRTDAVLGDYCGRLLALDARTGALRWSRSVNGRVYGTPAVAAGRVFVPSSTGGSLTAFSTSGRFLWRRGHRFLRLLVAGRVATDASSSAPTTASSTRCERANGATLWSRHTGGPISGAAVVVDGVAYAGSFAHRIVGVDVRRGRVVLDFPHGEYVPGRGRPQAAAARLLAALRGGGAVRRVLLAVAAARRCSRAARASRTTFTSSTRRATSKARRPSSS